MSTTRRSVRNKAQQDIRRKKRVLEHAARIGNVRKTCRYFGVARSGFYVWKKAYETHGDQGLINQRPFRTHTVRTDRGHEFQAQFHWHLADQGIRHVYIKARTPQLNGKVERSHRTDKQEFYQLLTYKGDVDLQAKLAEWENFYNYQRPHGAFQGKTPYEALREKLG